MTNKPTDLQASLRRACEEAAKNLPEPRGFYDGQVADIIERRLTPVFEALRISVIEECASLKFDERPIGDQNPYYEDAWACGWYTAIRNMRAAIRALKGAPR